MAWFPALTDCEIEIEGTNYVASWRRMPGFAVLRVPTFSPESWAICLEEELSKGAWGEGVNRERTAGNGGHHRRGRSP